MDKYIFLDLDGVMATSFNREDTPFGNIYRFGKGSVKNLNIILQQTNAKIVLSSTWRLCYDLPTLQQIFTWNGCEGVPIDVTPIPTSKDGSNMIVVAMERVDEIKQYVATHLKETDKWVAIDDENLARLGSDHFVRCGKMGLSEHKKIDQVIELLNM